MSLSRCVFDLGSPPCSRRRNGSPRAEEQGRARPGARHGSVSDASDARFATALARRRDRHRVHVASTTCRWGTGYLLKESIGGDDSSDCISIRTTSRTRSSRTTTSWTLSLSHEILEISSTRPATGSSRGRPSIRSIRIHACAICSSCRDPCRTARTRTRSTASSYPTHHAALPRPAGHVGRALQLHRRAALPARRAARRISDVEDPVLGASGTSSTSCSGARSRSSARSRTHARCART